MSPIARAELGSAVLRDRIERAADSINIDNAAKRRLEE